MKYVCSEEKILKLKQYIKILENCQIKTSSHCKNHYKTAEQNCTRCFHRLCNQCWKYHPKQSNEQIKFKPEVEVSCIQHKKPFVFYCEICKVNICSSCKEIHSSHHLIQLRQCHPKKLQSHLFDNASKKTHQGIKKLIRRIDNEISRLTQMRKDILHTFNINESINQGLKRLYQSLYRTIAFF